MGMWGSLFKGALGGMAPGIKPAIGGMMGGMGRQMGGAMGSMGQQAGGAMMPGMDKSMMGSFMPNMGGTTVGRIPGERGWGSFGDQTPGFGGASSGLVDGPAQQKMYDATQSPMLQFMGQMMQHQRSMRPPGNRPGGMAGPIFDQILKRRPYGYDGSGINPYPDSGVEQIGDY